MKHGQPESAIELTAGRRTLLRSLYNGVAEAEQMAMAANWLRDLTRHHGMPVVSLLENPLYQALDRRKANHLDTQLAAARWIDELLEKPMVANSRQVGGSHYNSRPIQHWDFVGGHDYGYLAAQVTKYLFRWRDKNGLQDVQKADHFLEKLIEVEKQHEEEGFVAPSIEEFLSANKIPEDEAYIMTMIHAFHQTRNPEFLALARVRMRRVLEQAPVQSPGG